MVREPNCKAVKSKKVLILIKSLRNARSSSKHDDLKNNVVVRSNKEMNEFWGVDDYDDENDIEEEGSIDGVGNYDDIGESDDDWTEFTRITNKIT